MNGGGGTHDDGADLEVIDLEPSASKHERREASGSSAAKGRRGPVIVAVLVVVALGTSAIVNRPSGSKRTTSTTRPDTVFGLAHIPLFPFRVGAQLLTTDGNALTLVDTDTGRSRQLVVDGMPQAQKVIAARSGSTVAVRAGRQLYWFTMSERRAHVADATTVFPAVQRGHLWFATPGFASEVPGPPHATKTHGVPIGATNGGLLVATKAGVVLQPAADVNDLVAPVPAPKVLLRAPATVLGVHPDRVAWATNDCGPLRCPVRVTEVATGATSTWLQLAEHPNPLVVAGTSAVFSPDGTDLAVIEPDRNVTSPATLIVADLRSRATIVLDALGRFDQPARPGSSDATGTPVQWTLDGRFLLLAPASGPASGALGLVDPGTRQMTFSRAAGLGSTISVTGASSSGPLDLPRRLDAGVVDTGGSSQLGSPGLTLVGADAQQVDVLTFATDQIHTWSSLARVALNSGVQTTVARVTSGWLVTRGNAVSRFPDHGGTDTNEFVAPGDQVFSANHGREAWIATADGGDYVVAHYDPATRIIGDSVVVIGMPVGAVDQGLVTVTLTKNAVRMEIVLPDGTMSSAIDLDISSDVLAAAGRNVAYRDVDGLHVYDVTTQRSFLVTAQRVVGAALSPDGENLAWTEAEKGPASKPGVRAMRLTSSRIVQLAAAGDRVFVTDRGDVLFTNGYDVRHGRVDVDGSSPFYGLAPDPAAILALG